MASNEHPSLDKSPQYKKFVTDRDKALERILQNYKNSHALVLKKLYSLIVDSSLFLWHQNQKIPQGRFQIQNKLFYPFNDALHATYELFIRMRRSVYILSYLGEAEAIGQALGKKTKVYLPKQEINLAIAEEHPLGGKLYERLNYTFNNLMRKVEGQIELSLITDESTEELLERIDRVMPSPVVVKRPEKQLRKLTEAEISRKPKVDFITGIYDEEEWNEMLEDYKTKNPMYTQFSRSEEPVEGDVRLEWEVERDINHDFLTTVRDAQKEASYAAEPNGIVDTVWLSESHETLCEHCEWRDGLTSKEIEDKIESMEDDPKTYGALIPPMHPHCHCDFAPVTKKDLELKPDKLTSKDFYEWLED